jgi:hypothetical protein
LKRQLPKNHVLREPSSLAPSGALSKVRPQARLEVWSHEWIPSLVEPYLRGYAPQFDNGDSLLGYRFLAQSSGSSRRSSKAVSPLPSAGFFIGYLLNTSESPFPKAAPPEFLVFCFIEPVGGRLHRRLVSEPESLMRRTAEYIRWLTHRPPRFELFDAAHAALVRHIPTQAWPASRTEHYARNFTIETLAWLVRSAIVRRLPNELAVSPQSSSNSKSRAVRK